MPFMFKIRKLITHSTSHITQQKSFEGPIENKREFPIVIIIYKEVGDGDGNPLNIQIFPRGKALENFVRDFFDFLTFHVIFLIFLIFYVIFLIFLIFLIFHVIYLIFFDFYVIFLIFWFFMWFFWFFRFFVWFFWFFQKVYVIFLSALLLESFNTIILGFPLWTYIWPLFVQSDSEAHFPQLLFQGDHKIRKLIFSLFC